MSDDYAHFVRQQQAQADANRIQQQKNEQAYWIDKNQKQQDEHHKRMMDQIIWSQNAPSNSSAGLGYAFEWWHLLLFPPTWPFFAAAGVLWVAFHLLRAIVRLVIQYRKAVSLALLVSGSIALIWGTIHVRGLAAYENGFPLDASTSTQVSLPVYDQQGAQRVDVYDGTDYGAGVTRTFCNLVGASHQYFFHYPTIDNLPRIESERLVGVEYLKINGGSVKNSTIIVRGGELVIIGSVTHSTLKAEKIIVKGNVSRDSTLVIVKPDPIFAAFRVRNGLRHKAAR